MLFALVWREDRVVLGRRFLVSLVIRKISLKEGAKDTLECSGYRAHTVRMHATS